MTSRKELTVSNLHMFMLAVLSGLHQGVKYEGLFKIIVAVFNTVRHLQKHRWVNIFTDSDENQYPVLMSWNFIIMGISMPTFNISKTI